MQGLPNNKYSVFATLRLNLSANIDQVAFFFNQYLALTCQKHGNGTVTCKQFLHNLANHSHKLEIGESRIIDFS